MPIGIQRLNASKPQPSDRIIFIKPLPGPSAQYAQDFLERIAAICHPIMKAAHLSIMTLEEHEPNPEFIGRNFNAGEIIQLVLKAQYTGRWLSFRSVQMVMVHELAHCLQMNHGRDFWKVRNQYAGELRDLWRKNYTGDGLWGRGQTLLSGEYDSGSHIENENLPLHLCGGTFRTSRRRKRKRGERGNEKPKETYAERQQRRIQRRFGVNGTALGGEDDTRVKLENGKKPKGKPRVAGSARGRELRAAAALARFDQVKEEASKLEEDTESGTETESDNEEAASDKQALKPDGTLMLDSSGNGMVRVCGNEDLNDNHVKREIEELHELADVDRPLESQRHREQANETTDRKSVMEPQRPVLPADHPRSNPGQTPTPRSTNPSSKGLWDIPQYVPPPEEQTGTKANNRSRANMIHDSLVNSARTSPNQVTAPEPPQPPSLVPTPAQNSERTCPICSMLNDLSTPLCAACSHVLDTDKVTRYWRCHSEACRGSEYINADDYGLCGICGTRKSELVP